MSKAEPASWGVTLHSAQLNGITQRYADTASTDAVRSVHFTLLFHIRCSNRAPLPDRSQERALPVLLFMHGWPESWFSWRHQLKACAAAGFRGIAPDVRPFPSPLRLQTFQRLLDSLRALSACH